MEATLARLYVGTSGFSYPSWRGGFYPADAKPADFLRFYAERLPSVELNSTFYQLPAQEQFERWAAETPPGFRFAVTMSRGATGRGRVEGVQAFCQSVRGLGDRLGPIRIKVPQARDDGFLLLLLGSLDADLSFALDFRHESWDAPEVSAQLDEHRIARVDSLEGTAPFCYLRFREPPYDDEALAAWAARLRPVLSGGTEVYAYFKHEDEPTGPHYAGRFLELADAGSERGFRSHPAGTGPMQASEEEPMADEKERDSEEALDEIGKKRAEGDEPSSEEREFLAAERVPEESDEGADRSDEGRGTPTY
jgi:uncharacterized protein YecE (DUF72 family)